MIIVHGIFLADSSNQRALPELNRQLRLPESRVVSNSTKGPSGSGRTRTDSRRVKNPMLCH